MEKKVAHLLYCPFTGLGLYGGYRGNRWLRNRIKIFKQFVVPSLQAQTNKHFMLWISWRYEDRYNPQVRELREWLLNSGIKHIFTFTGCCFWDDKYSDEVAHDRLVDAIHGAVPEVFNAIGEAEEILMTIQPSDDCYHTGMVQQVQDAFKENAALQAVTYRKGYVMDYKARVIAEWNPTTNPPFYTIRFTREVFSDPMLHVAYAGIKSHEYVEALNLKRFDNRGFLVGTHGENISTVFNHPFRGRYMDAGILSYFGLYKVPPLRIRTSLRKFIMRKLPHGWQRKLRYWLGERFAAKIYDFLRS
jgi:hypothetical protein